ncbi:MAG: hypothetical protein M3160_08735 [Candidatus Eremiobacteraeota bacterium]|nr:hypothetical protein [Candidatus Eremiobacteraeota bacterium]
METFDKLSVNVPTACAERLRALKFKHELSGSSLVELALLEYFDSHTDDEIAEKARLGGASRRRPKAEG